MSTTLPVAAMVVSILVAAPSPVVSSPGSATQPRAPAQLPSPLQQPSVSGTILEVDRVLRYALHVPVSAERAFDAWTDADQLVQWFAYWADMTVGEGEAYTMGWDGVAGVWQGTYLEVERPATLAFSWLPPEAVFPNGYPTNVRITFEELDEEDGGGTRIVLEHSGFQAVAELEAHVNAWRPYLFALRQFLLQQPEEGGA